MSWGKFRHNVAVNFEGKENTSAKLIHFPRLEGGKKQRHSDVFTIKDCKGKIPGK